VKAYCLSQETQARFAICTDDRPVGGIGLSPGTDIERVNAEIGYWLGAKYWGKGYATEAVRALIDYAFADLEFTALQSSVRVTNAASRRVLEKCGFQWNGVGLCRIRAIGSSVPVDRFRLERGIWTALKSWGPVKRVT